MRNNCYVPGRRFSHVSYVSCLFGQDIIETLATDEKDQILLRLLSQGRGSLQYAKNIQGEINDSTEPGPDRDAGAPEWCDCSVCRPMPLDVENVCCRKRTCVTSFAMYEHVCLDREVLTLPIRARFDILAEEPDYSTNSYRKAAYRQYCLWKYGKLGKGNRRVLPSCVVLKIRSFYPVPDGKLYGIWAIRLLLNKHSFIYCLDKLL